MVEMITIEHLDGGYGKDIVLNDLSLTVKGPSFVSLIGPNGSGKSTLVKFLYKELRPQKGTITIKGKDISTLTQKELAGIVSLVPQSGKVEENYTVLDVLEMGRFAHGSKKGNEEILHLCALESMKDRSVLDLSGGEAQRVMIARALAQGTEVLLLDEPLNNLDIAHQETMLHLFKQLSQEGVTVLAVLHDLAMAQAASDRVIMMEAGTIVAQGKADEVITKERIEEVYHAPVHYLQDPQSGANIIAPLW